MQDCRCVHSKQSQRRFHWRCRSIHKHTLCNYWATNQAYFTDITIQKILLSIQNGSGKTPRSNSLNTIPAKAYSCKPWNSHNVARTESTKPMSTPTQRTRRCSTSPPALQTTTQTIQSLESSYANSFLSSMPSLNPSSCEVCYDMSHQNPNCQLLTQDSLAQLSIIRFHNMEKSSCAHGQERPNRVKTFRGNRFQSRIRGGQLSFYRSSRPPQSR